MRDRKYTDIERIGLVEEFKHSGLPVAVFEQQHGLSKMRIRRWLDIYETEGFDGLRRSPSPRIYSEKVKDEVVRAYLDGEGSMDQLRIRFGLRSASQVSDWVSRYNGTKVKAASVAGKKDRPMPRKTTLEDRIAVVEYVERDHHTYMQAAEHFKVSYQQARSWTHKFRKGGNEALVDLRGHHKPESELTEIDRLRLENRQLKAELANKKLVEEFTQKFLATLRKEQTRNK